MDALERQSRLERGNAEMFGRVGKALSKLRSKVEFLESNAEAGLPMRKSFPDKETLDLFTGWPGLVGFVAADSSEYVWRSGWKVHFRSGVWDVNPVANGGTFTLGAGGVVSGEFEQRGRRVTAFFRIVFGASPSITDLIIDLPVALDAAVYGAFPLGDIEIIDVSAGAGGRWEGRILVASPVNGRLYHSVPSAATSPIRSNALTSTSPILALAVGDHITGKLSYPARDT